MKIKEFAELKMLTKAAIYNQIKRNGLSVSQITDKEGNITETGRKILEGIFEQQQERAFNLEEISTKKTDGERLRAEAEELREKLIEATSSRDALQVEREELRARLAQAEERAEKWERLYLELQDRAAQEREQHAERERETKLLLAQQMDTNRYLSMNPIRRLFSGRNKKSVEAQAEIK